MNLKELTKDIVPQSFKLVNDTFDEKYKERQWTYACLFTLIINKRQINKITITDHAWEKKGRQMITKELILDIFKEELNGLTVKPTNYPKRKVFKRSGIPYQEKKYKIVFWFENNDPNWLWVRTFHQQD